MRHDPESDPKPVTSFLPASERPYCSALIALPSVKDFSASLYSNAHNNHRLTIVSAPHGYGKQSFFVNAQECAGARGFQTIEYDFSSREPREFDFMLMRLYNQLAKKDLSKKQYFAVFRGLYSQELAHHEKLIDIIQLYLRANAQVLLLTQPAYLPFYAKLMPSAELVDQHHFSPRKSDMTADALAATHAIPALVVAWNATVKQRRSCWERDSTYFQALAQYLSELLSDGERYACSSCATAEEHVRSFLALLACGTIDEHDIKELKEFNLACFLREESQVSGLVSHKSDTSTYELAGVMDDAVYIELLQNLSLFYSDRKELSWRLALHLMKCRRYLRASALLSICLRESVHIESRAIEGIAREMLVYAHGLVAIGKVQVVEGLLRLTQGIKENSWAWNYLSELYSMLTSETGYNCNMKQLRESAIPHEDVFNEQIYVDLIRALAHIRRGFRRYQKPYHPLSLKLANSSYIASANRVAKHLCYMISGEFLKVFDEISFADISKHPRDIFDLMEMRLASHAMQLCGYSSLSCHCARPESHYMQREMERTVFGLYAQYADHMVEMLTVGMPIFGEADQACSRTKASNDEALNCIFLLGDAIVKLHAHLLPSARASALEANQLAQQLGMEYMQQASVFVGFCIDVLETGEVSPQALRHLHGSHKLIAGLLSTCVYEHTLAQHAAVHPGNDHSSFNEAKLPSRNNGWEFLLLHCVLGDYTAYLIKNAPKAWRQVLCPSLNNQIKSLCKHGELEMAEEIIKRNPVLAAHQMERPLASDGLAESGFYLSQDTQIAMEIAAAEYERKAVAAELSQQLKASSDNDSLESVIDAAGASVLPRTPVLAGNYSPHAGSLAGPLMSTTDTLTAVPQGSSSAAQTSAAEKEPGPLIEIRMLNQLSIRMNGVLLNPSELRTRRLGEVLSYLGLQGQYRARRFDIISAVWGECDFEYGMRRLYEAASATRKCARDKGIEENILKISKVEGSIFLNPEQVYCDVHDFEHQAQDMLKHNYSDEDIIRYGCKALALFGRGAEFYPGDWSGAYMRRVREINNLFGDVSIEVCAAALRLGKSRLASQTIEAAFSLLPIREDIVLALLETLKDNRRIAEIATFISVYRAHLRTIGVNRVPPCVERSINRIIEETKRDYHDIPRLGYHDSFDQQKSIESSDDEDKTFDTASLC